MTMHFSDEGYESSEIRLLRQLVKNDGFQFISIAGIFGTEVKSRQLIGESGQMVYVLRLLAERLDILF